MTQIASHRRILKISIAVVVVLLAAFLIWVRMQIIRSTEASRNIWSFERALRYYLLDHNGDLPSSMSDLLQAYCVQEEDGDWLVALRTDIDGSGSSEYLTLRNPSWFDVAWNAKAGEIGGRGEIVGRDRLAVQPSKEAPSGFDGYCRMVNAMVGRTVSDIRTRSATTIPSD